MYLGHLEVEERALPFKCIKWDVNQKGKKWKTTYDNIA